MIISDFTDSPGLITADILTNAKTLFHHFQFQSPSFTHIVWLRSKLPRKVVLMMVQINTVWNHDLRKAPPDVPDMISIPSKACFIHTQILCEHSFRHVLHWWFLGNMTFSVNISNHRDRVLKSSTIFVLDYTRAS